jgi:two-component system cell cycle sensor histidine kinase/response regulator CckA
MNDPAMSTLQSDEESSRVPSAREDSSPPPADHPLYSREVFDHISVCMFLVDVTPESRFRYAGFNAAEERAVGLSTAQVSGKFVEDVFDERLARKLIGNYRSCLEAGAPVTYEDELDLPGGRRYFHSNLIPIRNAAGRIYRIVGACTDMTDLKRAQEDALARQKLEGIGLLAAGIAHDFNNLLGSILAEAELAETEMHAGVSPTREVRTIKSVAIRAGEIVRELMVYAGQEQRSLELVDLSAVVEEMLELLKISISKNATLEFDLPKGLPAVRANPAQIQQVVLNLITNASEAVGETGGTISVAVGRVESLESNTRERPQGSEFLRLTVRDTGSGMTDEVRPRIFDPFYTTKFAGRGLGLSAVQGIVRSHGGSIEVRSTPGAGSQFEILLPCISPGIGVRDESKLPDDADETVGTILLVEDEEILRSAVSKLLRNHRFEVIEAPDGIAGTKLFACHSARIDVVLLDLTLPGISGREVLQEVYRISPDAKVILTSAYSESMFVVTAGQKPWGFIRKPYKIHDLVSILSKACDKSSSQHA